MASPHEAKLPEQQSSNSDPTTPPTPATVESPSAEIAGDPAQEDNEAVVLTLVADGSDTENHHSEQVDGAPNQVVSDTAVMVISAGAINPQKQASMEAATAAPTHWIKTTPDDLGADIEEESEFDDEEGFDTDRDGIWSPLDLEPTVYTGEETGTNVLGYGEAPKSIIRAGNASIVNNMEEYVIDGPIVIDGVSIEDSEDKSSEDNDESGDENHVNEDMCSRETDQGKAPEGSALLTPQTIVTKASAESDHGNGEDRCLVTPSSAGPDLDDAVTIILTASSIDDGEHNGSMRLDPIDSDHNDGVTSGSLATGPSEEHNDEPRTPGFGNADEEHSSSVAATPAGSSHGDNETRGSVTATSAGPEDGIGESSSSTTPPSASSDHGDVESSEPEMAMPVCSEQAGEKNDGPVFSSVASEEHTPASSREIEIPDKSSLPMEAAPCNITDEGEDQETAATPAQDDEQTASQADAEIVLYPSEIPESPLQPTLPLGEDPKDFDLEEGEVRDLSTTSAQEIEESVSESDWNFDHSQEEVVLYPSEIPESPLQPTLPLGEDPKDFDLEEGEVRDLSTTSAQEIEESVSEADWNFDHSREEVVLFSSEMPEHPVQPTLPLGEDPNDFDLNEGEATPNPVDRVSILTGYQGLELRGIYGHVGGSQSEEGHIEREQRDVKLSGRSQGEAISADRVLSPFGPDDRVAKTGNKDGNTVHLRIQYLVAYSKRSKASMCISVPAAITYTAFKQTILNALRQHGEFKNPRPIHRDAQISRLIAVLATEKADPPDFRRVTELTDENLQRTLELMHKRSIYDAVKVQFVPGTNGDVMPRKATGRINGRSRKVGGL